MKKIRNLCIISMFLSAVCFSYLDMYAMAIFAIFVYLVAGIMAQYKINEIQSNCTPTLTAIRGEIEKLIEDAEDDDDV